MRKYLAGSFALAVLALFWGCQKGADNSTGPNAGSGIGTIEVRLTDAPAGYDAVNVAVDSIRVHVETSDSVGGWFTISRSPAVYNLLDFMGGKDTLIAEGQVPAGYYSQMRLYIGTGSTIVVDSVVHPLVIPSGSQSGLKLNIQAMILAGAKYVLVLDFNASSSVVLTGNGQYLLKPVINVVTTQVSGG